MVGMVLQLLSTDKRGNLKEPKPYRPAPQVCRRERSEQFLDGVKVIEEAASPLLRHAGSSPAKSRIRTAVGEAYRLV